MKPQDRINSSQFLASIYARRQTLYEHQLWLKRYLGLNDVDQAGSDPLVCHLSAQANEVNSVDELVMAACRWLYEHKLLSPSDPQVRDLACKCYAGVEAGIFDAIGTVIPAKALSRCQDTGSARLGRSGAIIVSHSLEPGPDVTRVTTVIRSPCAF